MLENCIKKKFILFPIVFIILSGFLFLPIVYSLSEHYSKTDKVEANIIVVEGWLPQYGIKMAYDEFQLNGYDLVVTTGLKSTPEYFNLFTNGSLIFYADLKDYKGSDTIKHFIEVNAFSSLNGPDKAKFNLTINDSVFSNFIADKNKKRHLTEFTGSLTDIDSISIQFLNDLVTENGDRNLFVKEIIIDHKITIPYQRNSIYMIPGLFEYSKFNNDYDSYAEQAKHNLIAMGLDSSLIISIPAKKTQFNRTLSSALAFRDWLNKSDIKVKGINIVTMGTHAKRTYMTYNKLLDKKYKIGIISLPDYRANYSRRYKVLKTLRETIGIVYYWIILLSY